MSQFTRPTFNVDDDDLERLQEEFFSKEVTPSAKVYRKSAPVMSGDKPKKKSLFSERLHHAESSSTTTAMPALEDPTSMPALESSTTVQDVPEGYEPVMDPNPEPHVPVSKKMIDLTSLLGQVLGEITEHEVKEVKAPALPTVQEGKPSKGQQEGFPKPVHRSEFKKRLEAKRNQATAKPRVEKPPQVAPASSSSQVLNVYDDENDRRIGEMTADELEEARQEIMSTLSPESIALLMKGLKSKKSEPINKEKKQVTFDTTIEDDKDDLLKMKAQYFADVPVENDKLAWMDQRFMTPELQKQQEQESNNEAEASEAEKIYRKLRFDLQGKMIDTAVDIPRHKGLHHHGDEPDKAGYTLAELFYLARSTVPSQRSMVLTTLARIITLAKQHPSDPVWTTVLSVFTGKEHAATIYLRSALDDRNLVVLVSAIHALSALVLDQDEASWIQSLLEANTEFLGHIAHPKTGATKIKRKGLNEKLTELVDRVRQTTVEDQADDAELAERDLIRGLVKMKILPRIRYLISGELIQMDPTSVELLVRILVRMAEAGQDVCEAIEEEELLEPLIEWGIVNTSWPMLEDTGNYPSLATVRLLGVLGQGSKQIAATIVEKANITLRYLVTDPVIACEQQRMRAYALALQTLKLVYYLTCYGFVLPTLEDLHEPVMTWFRVVLVPHSVYEATRAAIAMGLLEVLLHAAADPHKTQPEHAMDWHQPTAYLPAIIAVLKANQEGVVYEAALGYLGAWASYLDKFPTGQDVSNQVWKAVVENDDLSSNSVALGYTTTTNHVLRYIQFIVAFKQQQLLRSAQLLYTLKELYQSDLCGRYAFWLWIKHVGEPTKSWGMSLGLAQLEVAIRASAVEAWVAQDLLHFCLDNKTLGDLRSSLGPFYFAENNKEVELSKAIYNFDGRPLKTFMYSVDKDEELSSLETTAFILSPVDGLYHLDKSKVAQKSKDDAATLVANTMELANKLFYTSDINHDVALVTLMKIFMIGDREGQQPDMITEREIFWDDRVKQDMTEWLDYLCKTGTNLASLEHAWRRSSEYIRQAQVPFFQFYQGFVAQYAAVSFGHHGFARLLVYLVTQIDTTDYRHLLFSDYREVLPTLQVTLDELPPLLKSTVDELTHAGLKL